jgi:hypothetical protein
MNHPYRPPTTYLFLTSSSGFGGGGGKLDLSILRSRAFFLPALDLAFFPMIYLAIDILSAAVVWARID